MKMNVLRCTTLGGVVKELAVYLSLYNLVRLAMLKAADAQGADAERVSFVDTPALPTQRRRRLGRGLGAARG